MWQYMVLLLSQKNAQPISSINWLCMLEKGTKLRKPLRLIILHFLSDMTRDQLYNHQVGFTKANHHNYIIENSEMKYKFHLCDSEPLFASKRNKSFAILESDHCCFYCLQAKQTPELVRDAGYQVSYTNWTLSITAKEWSLLHSPGSLKWTTGPHCQASPWC